MAHIVDTALDKRFAEGNPVRVGLVGAGFMAAGLVSGEGVGLHETAQWRDGWWVMWHSPPPLPPFIVPRGSLCATGAAGSSSSVAGMV